MTYCVMEFPWDEPVATNFTSKEEAQDWIDKHSGSYRDCRYVKEETHKEVKK